MKILKSITSYSKHILGSSTKFAFKCLKWVVIGVITSIIVINFTIGTLYIMTPEDHSGCNVCKTRELKLRSLKYELIEKVDNYIQYVGPGSCLNGIALVEACEMYDIDLKFALAQGHIESHFGTKGIASKTNSVFNVGSWDGLSSEQIKKFGNGYSHPDHSVIPYLEKLKNSYLVKKTENDMFKKFVNIRGERYASNPNYENQLKRIYDNIDSVCDISRAYSDYKTYKGFLNK